VPDLVNMQAGGIFHVVGDERISKYDFGLKIAEKFELDRKLISPGLLSEHETLVQRPYDMSLSNQKVCDMLGRKLGGVDEHLTRLLQQEKSGFAREVQSL
jgi:dTDP-4-dehydrorhamnose reductase